ncbi:hypothetical protein IV203_026025 [Nitzschia inconspicua]|uniref:Uncharacterized protein n=1 Tax=Nitzschia inconspicua TaxID=303405 RepID=A0A9K3P8K0_9STRA|nr:hypothetical protein IV203_009423 [Nitzschia inconspicua]KAG7362665.1 hypothetical protein IV203_026025 [Nitzschia inconspicua]
MGYSNLNPFVFLEPTPIRQLYCCSMKNNHQQTTHTQRLAQQIYSVHQQSHPLPISFWRIWLDDEPLNLQQANFGPMLIAGNLSKEFAIGPEIEP